MHRVLSEVGRKFARVATVVAVRNPRLWRFFRPLMRRQFDAIASEWDTMRDPDHLAPYERALQAVDPAPTRALDLGTGTGQGAFAIARRFPAAEVIGADLSERMLAQARSKTPPGLGGRIRFERADASRLPYADGSFELVAHANMIPFFDELARVLAPGGQALFAFSGGAETPIYVATERLREELSRRGFAEFADITEGKGSGLLARKVDRN
jgi:ubiquinone/menaquinone biosynthesis C-methylase UbiE